MTVPIRHPGTLALWMIGAVSIVGVVLFSLSFPAAWLVMLVPGVVVAARRPEWMLALLAASIPAQSVASFAVGDVQMTLTKACLICVFAGWAARAVEADLVIDATAWAYGLLLATMATSILAAPEIGRWMSEVYQWGVALAVYLIARSTMHTVRHVEWVLVGMAAGTIGVALWSIVQVAREDGPPSFVVNGVLRAYGTFGEPNPLAAYLELVVPLLGAMVFLPRLWRRRSWRPRPVDGVMLAAIVLGTTALILTQSRGGWLGTLAALMVLAIALPRRVQLGVATMTIGLLAIAFLTTLLDFVATRLTALGDVGDRWRQVTSATWANEERRAHWGAAWRMMLDNPWTGVGVGEFSDRYREYTPEWRFRVSRGHAHNGPLHFGATAGIPGILAFLGWILTALIMMLTRLRGLVGTGKALTIGCIGSFAAFIVHSLVDYLNVLSLGIQIALLLALSQADLDDAPVSQPEGRGLE